MWIAYWYDSMMPTLPLSDNPTDFKHNKSTASNNNPEMPPPQLPLTIPLHINTDTPLQLPPLTPVRAPRPILAASESIPPQITPGRVPLQTTPGRVPLQTTPGRVPLQTTPGHIAPPQTTPARVPPPQITPARVPPPQITPQGAPNSAQTPRSTPRKTRKVLLKEVE